MFFIYILKSEKSDKYYIGHTDNPKRRINEHNESSHLTFTSKHRPWKLMAHIPISENRSEAMVVEKYIKGRKSKKFIEEIILNQSDVTFIEKLKRFSSVG